MQLSPKPTQNAPMIIEKEKEKKVNQIFSFRLTRLGRSRIGIELYLVGIWKIRLEILGFRVTHCHLLIRKPISLGQGLAELDAQCKLSSCKWNYGVRFWYGNLIKFLIPCVSLQKCASLNWRSLCCFIFNYIWITHAANSKYLFCQSQNK